MSQAVRTLRIEATFVRQSDRNYARIKCLTKLTPGFVAQAIILYMALKSVLDENVDRVYQTQLLRQYPEFNEYQERIVYLPLP